MKDARHDGLPHDHRRHRRIRPLLPCGRARRRTRPRHPRPATDVCARHRIDEHTPKAHLDRPGPETSPLHGSTPADTVLRIAHQHALAHGATDVDTHILDEPALPALLHLAAATAADLIVTANPHRSPLLAQLLSTPPIELARKTHCDILITA
ncbi:universal stress protein [Nocardia farcinica]|uniref:universal stress protein n=1 Tax=Nocardia farcinica TaxID=37329 RepID=UPI0024583855|nr:universal stress protein [Nocardia farcinica]